MGPKTVATLPRATARFGRRRLGHRLTRGVLLLLLLLLAATMIPGTRGDKSYLFQPRSREYLPVEDCPTSCSDLFGRAEEASYIGGRRVQTTRVQERGGMFEEVFGKVNKARTETMGISDSPLPAWYRENYGAVVVHLPSRSCATD